MRAFANWRPRYLGKEVANARRCEIRARATRAVNA